MFLKNCGCYRSTEQLADAYEPASAVQFAPLPATINRVAPSPFAPPWPLWNSASPNPPLYPLVRQNPGLEHI